MSTATKPSIPPPPADTAGRWLDVIREDSDMVRRWLHVMYQMDGHYRREGTEAFGYCMAHRPSSRGASYYYWTPSCEIALRLLYVPVRAQHMVLSVGFLGSISPAAALDLVVEQSVHYLRERKASATFAVVRKQMDAPQILKLYALVPTHPRLRVTVEDESAGALRWHIEIPELRKP